MSSPAPATCHRCGAVRGPDAPLYCKSCGAKQAAGVEDLGAYRIHPERFDLVTQHPAYPAAVAWRPRLSWSREVGQPVTMLIPVGMFAAIWLSVASLVAAPRAFELGGIAVIGVAVLAALWGVGRGLRRMLARSERLVAVVVADRVRRQEDLAGVAPHQVTLRLRDGSRRDALATGDALATVVTGDVGVAYLQLDRLAEFRWFDVMPAALPPGEPARPPTCPHCAAPLRFDTRAHCTFCGTALPEPELGEHGARFVEVSARPATAAALTGRPRGGMPSLVGPSIMTGLGLLGVVGAWTLREVFVFFAQEWPPALMVLIPPVLLLLIGAIWLWRRSAAWRSPLLRTVALILRTRREVWATVNDRPVYRHFAMIGTSNGARRELRCAPAVAERLAVGQMGVAYLRGSLLVDFAAIDAAIDAALTTGATGAAAPQRGRSAGGDFS